MKGNTGGKKRGREGTVDCNSREQRFKTAKEELNYRSCLCVQSKASLRVNFGPAGGDQFVYTGLCLDLIVVSSRKTLEERVPLTCSTGSIRVLATMDHARNRNTETRPSQTCHQACLPTQGPPSHRCPSSEERQARSSRVRFADPW